MKLSVKLGIVLAAAALLVTVATYMHPVIISKDTAEKVAQSLLVLLAISLSLHFLLLPREHENPPPQGTPAPVVPEVTDPVQRLQLLVAERKEDIGFSALAFVAFSQNAMPVAALARDVHKVSQRWGGKPKPLEMWEHIGRQLLEYGFVERVTPSEYGITKLGRLYVAMALVDEHYRPVANEIAWRAYQ